MLYDAFDREGPGEEVGGGGAIARLQRIANAARGDHAALVTHRPHRGRAQPMRRAEFAQHLHIAAAPLTESEILTRDDRRNAEPFDHQFDDEVFRRGARKHGIEIENQHRIRACRFEQRWR